MSNYVIDFETKSSNPIDYGIPNYLSSPQSAIVCMGWKRDNEKTRLWTPAHPPPFQINPEDKVYAFNVSFDWQVWDVLGYQRSLLPELPKDNLIDVMALCGRYTLFQSLDMAAAVLKLKHQKDRRGKLLIRKICIPPFKHTHQELVEFFNYCIRDVDATYELIHSLPTPELSVEEQRIWRLTFDINRRGVPVDSMAVNRIFNSLNMYVDQENAKLPIITNGRITTNGQVGEIVKWAFSLGVELPNLTKATVVAFIAKLEGLPVKTENTEKVLEVLKLRQKLGMTSTAKYKKLMNLEYNGRIYENLRYHGAATGRWAGLGAQLHNLPRASVDNPEEMIGKFYDGSIMNEDLMGAAKALIRPMICAPKGRVLVVVDYKAIENRNLMWLCDEWAALQLIGLGRDQYIDMASDLYAIGYDDITAKQRALGKTLILGAGYNLGGKGFRAYAGGYGIPLTEDEADMAIKKYRAKYPNVVKYWYAAKDTVIHAIQNPGVMVVYGKCQYIVIQDHKRTNWLALTLPSGRSLFYQNPELKEDKYGLLPTHMGINSYTRKWDRLKLIPGRIIENIVQASSRDIMADAKLRMDSMGFEIVLSVHDEIVVECDKDKADAMLNDMINTMRVPPVWAEGMPLDGDGFITRRYKKG